MATNEATSLRNALVAILLADAQLQSLAGVSSGFVVTWQSIAAHTQRPVLAYLMTTNNRTGGSSHRRVVQVLLGAYAKGNGAQDTAEAMTRRAREVLTKAAFAALSVEAEVMVADERGEDPLQLPDTNQQEARHDLDLLIELTAPS